MPPMNKQSMRLEIKEISEQGYFEGLLSPYGNVDQGGDVVLPGAYTKTLQEGGTTRPMLWQHKTDAPIGQLTLEDTAAGLWCKGQLLMDLPEAHKAYLLLKARIINGLSIGFTAIKDEVANGIRKLKEIKLYEGSIVTFPMNEFALITSVKSGHEKKGDFNEELTARQLSSAGYQMQSALGSALDSLIYSGLSKDEILSATETVIEQFATAYMAYMPAYIDMLSARYGAIETWAKEGLEIKAGRKISADTMKSIKGFHGKMMAHKNGIAKECKDFSALWDDEAADDEDDADTSKSEAAIEQKSEPEISHSASLLVGLTQAMSLVRCNAL